MFRNYFLIALRNLIKNRIFSLVNILGLATGITACLFISMYVNYQKSYDNFYEKGDDLYRVRWERYSDKGDEIRFASACPAVGRTLQETFPEVLNHARSYKAKGVFSYREQVFQEENVFWAENEYLKLLSYNLLQGNADKALVAENTVVISESIAKKYFKNEDPIGKFLSYDQRLKLEVTGVFKDRPENVHCKTDLLISFPTFIRMIGQRADHSWLYSGFYTYIQLKEGTDPAQIEARIPQLLQDKIGDLLKQYQLEMAFFLQPVKDIHLTSHYMHELDANGDSKTINFLFIIAYFIILIAWVNFLNLSTISYIRRAREVGLRKVVGATRYQIIRQFLLEAVIINLIAIGISLILLELLMPFFRNLTAIPENFRIWNHSWLYINLIGMLFVGVFVSGMYPVWGLTFSDMNKMLKGDFKGSRTGLLLRKGLVLVQFVISIVLIAGTLSVVRQLNFMRNSNPGFDKNHVIVLNTPTVGDSTLLSRREAFKSELTRRPEIQGVAYSSIVPGKAIVSNLGSIYKEGDEPTSSKNYRLVRVDHDFLELYGMTFLKGRNFSREYPSDKGAVVVNEKAALHLGFAKPEDAVGSRIHMGRDFHSIIGVIGNYAHRSPKEEFEPEIFHIQPGLYGYLSVKLIGKPSNEILGQIKDKYNQLFTGNPFDYYFLNESYDAQYQEDERFSKVFGIFAILGMIITSLGLLSLSAFSANQRRKEIGVRKVLGASVQRLLLMLSKEYIILLGIAAAVVLPLFYWGLNNWLNGFAKKMDIPVWMFILPILVVGVISVFTISYQSFKTANQNPVESIKCE
ncbi:MAG: ABC transporter permease [Marinifilaceae bacterium]